MVIAPIVGNQPGDAVQPRALRIGRRLDRRVDEELTRERQHRGLELRVVEEVGAVERDAADVGAVVAAERDHEGARVRLARLLLAPANPHRGHQLSPRDGAAPGLRERQTVLRRSMAMVIGPDAARHRGQPAGDRFDTRPIDVAHHDCRPRGVVPTSMTKAPGLT